MKKFKRIISVILCCILAAVVFPVSASAEEMQDIETGYQRGDLFSFGSYPQTEVIDPDTVAELNRLCEEEAWISFGWSSGNGEQSSMTQRDFGVYQDVDCDGSRYRAVKFSEYRPDWCGDKTTAEHSLQDDNGYGLNTVYWFKYEPLVWRILDPEKGLMLCESVIDAQPNSNFISYGFLTESNAAGEGAGTYYKSTVRSWLKTDFFEAAFNTEEQKLLTGYSFTADRRYGLFSGRLEFAGYEINDLIFNLPWDEAAAGQYGQTTESLMASGTDYAKVNGLEVGKNGKSPWHVACADYTSGANDGSAFIVTGEGERTDVYKGAGNSRMGIRPACCVNLEQYRENNHFFRIFRDNNRFLHSETMFFNETAVLKEDAPEECTKLLEDIGYSVVRDNSQFEACERLLPVLGKSGELYQMSCRIGEEDILFYVKVPGGANYRTLLINRLLDGLSSAQQSRVLKKMFSSWDGSCYGLSLSIAFDNMGALDGVLGEEPYYSFASPKENTALRDVIQYYQLCQYRQEYAPDVETFKGGFLLEPVGSIGGGGSAGIHLGAVSMADFLQSLVEEAKKSETEQIPVILSYSYRDSGDNGNVTAAHTVIVCGYWYDSAKALHEIDICDPNECSKMLKLYVRNDCATFTFVDGNGIPVSDDWLIMELTGTEKMKMLMSSAPGQTAGNSPAADAPGRVTLSVSPFTQMKMTNEAGETLYYDGNTYGGTMKVYSARMSGCSSRESSEDGAEPELILSVDSSDRFVAEDMDHPFEASVEIDGTYYSARAAADRIVFSKDSGITLEGQNGEFTCAVGKKFDGGNHEVLEVSAAAEGNVNISVPDGGLLLQAEEGCSGLQAVSYREDSCESTGTDETVRKAQITSPSGQPEIMIVRPTGSLTVENQVTGVGDRAKSFTFCLKLTDEQGDALTGSYAFEKSDGESGSIKAGDSFSLMDGQQIIVSGLPSGAHYMVTEAQADDGGYQTTAQEAEGSIKEGNTLVRFINHLEKLPRPAVVVIRAKKTLDGKTPGENVFTFVLKDQKGNILQTKNNQNDEIVFDPLSFSDPGAYLFTVSEQKGADGKILYDSTVYQAVVTVTASQNGDASASVSWEKNSQPYSGIPVFENATAAESEGSAESGESGSPSGSSGETENSGQDSTYDGEQGTLETGNGDITQGETSGPSTGDREPLALWIVLAAAGLVIAGCAAACVIRKRK